MGRQMEPEEGCLGWAVIFAAALTLFLLAPGWTTFLIMLPACFAFGVTVGVLGSKHRLRPPLAYPPEAPEEPSLWFTCRSCAKHVAPATQEFGRWVNRPKCQTCGGSTVVRLEGEFD